MAEKQVSGKPGPDKGGKTPTPDKGGKPMGKDQGKGGKK